MRDPVQAASRFSRWARSVGHLVDAPAPEEVAIFTLAPSDFGAAEDEAKRLAAQEAVVVEIRGAPNAWALVPVAGSTRFRFVRPSTTYGCCRSAPRTSR